MQLENVLTEYQNGILQITLQRPKALNALNSRTLDELSYIFGQYATTLSELKGVILTGSGERAFAAGADISEFEAVQSEADGANMARRGHQVFQLIEQFRLPVIAAVNGFALGGGCELAMACHLRIASENAKFGQPEVNLGLIPGYGGTQRLIQYIGKSKALELLLTADLIDANEAYRLGLVNHVVPQAELIPRATALLEKIATKAPIAVQQAIACVNAYFQPLQSGYEAEITAFGACTTTIDFREGTAAFLAKRPANFQGR